jgi:hypothetical protein
MLTTLVPSANLLKKKPTASSELLLGSFRAAGLLTWYNLFVQGSQKKTMCCIV